MKFRTSTLFLFLAPVVLVLLVFFIYPLAQTLRLSFFEVGSFTSPPTAFRGLNNYLELVQTPLFIRSAKNVLILWVVGGVAVFASAFVLSALLTAGPKYKDFFRAAIYFPNIINSVALVAMWTLYIYNPRYGLFKWLGDHLHLPFLSQTQWSSPDMIFWAMLIAYVWGSIGWFTLLLLAGIERIPADLYEASKLEGANLFQNFTYITLPLLRDVLRVAVTMWSITAFNLFVFPKLFAPVTQDPAVSTPTTYLYGLAFGSDNTSNSLQIGKASAAAIMILVTVLLVSAVIGRLFGKDRLQY